MEVTLTRNSWHFKLQEFVFDDVPFQKNFCPYFWLTIFCLLSLPYVALWVFVIKKPVVLVGTALFDAIDKLLESFETKVCVPYKERTLNSITPEQAFVLFEAWDNPYGRRRDELAEKFSRWRNFFLSKWDSEEAWRAFVEKGREKVLEQRKRDEEMKREKEKVDAVRKQRIQKIHLWIIKVTKILFFSLGTVLVLAVTGFLLVGLKILWESRANIWQFFANYGFAIMGIIVLIVAFVGLIFLAIEGAKCYARMTPPKVQAEEKDSRAVSAIKSFFSFFWLFIVNFKKNHCPHIEWVE